METAEQRFSEPSGLIALWFGVLAGPAAWKLQLVLNYTLVPYACWQDMAFLNHVASLVTFLLSLLGGWVSWRSWEATGRGFDLELGGPVGRSRFMAISGLIFSVYFAIVILGQWIPNLLLSPCDGLH
jgi:hypothetical protein